MIEQYKLLLALLKSGITGQPCPIPKEIPFDDIIKMARKHDIISLVYMGTHNCGIPKTVTAPIRALHLRSIFRASNQMALVAKLLKCFDENGIDYLPLKGCHLRSFYSTPEARTMGDADILIRVSQYEKIRSIMQSLDFQEAGESNHELIWSSPTLLVELHKRLIPSYNEDYYRYFGDGWQLAVPETGTRYTMRPEDEFIYLFTHFAKHYRDGGVGCRQAADLWVFRRANPDMDEAYIGGELEKLGLDKFYENIQALLNAWFEDGPWSAKTEFITNFIFDSGLFGRKETGQVARSARNTEQGGSVARGRLVAAAKALFPDAVDMSNRYPVLKKAPWLKPVLWPVRWVSAALFRKDNIRRQRDKITEVDPEQVKTYQQALHYVGLTFGFDDAI